ncbi:MAG: cysteine desulfurase [Acetatifactor sp.]|nr:cysteine desulfurase [Acetatifactor sp.]
MIYFDNAATTEMCEPALSALVEVSKTQYGNASTLYGYGRKAKELLEEARGIIAQCIGADADEIFFTSGGTESDNWVINQARHSVDRIIVSDIEHHAILHPVARVKEEGMDVIFLPVDEGCNVIQDSLQSKLEGKKVLVSVMFQNNETGVIQDISSLADTVHKYSPESFFHTDAVQAIGHRRINVHELGVDMLSASAHKFNGPKGIGFLYIRRDCQLLPLILGGGQEKGLRSGTENIAGIYSMAKALEDNIALLEENENHIKFLEEIFLCELSRSDISYKINGDVNKKAIGIINIAIEGADGEGLLNMLDMHDICVSMGSACNSKSKEQSHVLLAMGLDEDRINSSIRISIGRYNKEEEIIELVKWIKKYYELSNIARA